MVGWDLIYTVPEHMNTISTASEESFDPRHNITAKELDRDLLNLHLPEIDLIATDEECEAMYPPGVYRQMMKQILGQSEGERQADTC
ncbi:hypothetical protein [Hymenobacter sp. BRD67]|uniref:hypothetical protein n=1 Tax=Hymenobacter sp. BRD67 TaxID=2675877 RepID=UPI00156346DF|nr:hypothetical protein [Hymenobacter sp. BRD67]QKG55034.1 hypothetical protein GKZ67_21660 [Hymenobacter sp. BRD67]